MASMVVVDAGILVAGVLDEKVSAQARAILKHWEQRKTLFNAPALYYEITAVTRKAVFQKRISPERGVVIRDNLLSIPIQLHMDDSLLKRAYDLATQMNRPTAYDAQYLAVAERLNCDFWTADERLFNAVSSQLAWVKWVGNFAQSPES